jgi:hypothetical protein
VGAINFGAGDLKAAPQQNGYSVSDLPLSDLSGATPSVRITLTTSDASVPGKPPLSGLAAQGYAIQRVVDGSATNWWVIGQDAAGAMYGGLELAEAVKLADGLAGVTNRQANPYFANRGIRFNILLDARSPSYSDDSSPAQANVANMWETNFWTGPGHPVAAGLSAGTHTVAAVAGDLSRREPGGSPIIIARLDDGSNHPSLYAYEAGAAMSSGTPPARRVHLFLKNETFAVLNADGLRLFDAAAGWAMGEAVPSWFHPPVLQRARRRLEWVGGGTLQTATNVLGPWSAVSGAVRPDLHSRPTPHSSFV